MTKEELRLTPDEIFEVKELVKCGAYTDFEGKMCQDLEIALCEEQIRKVERCKS